MESSEATCDCVTTRFIEENMLLQSLSQENYVEVVRVAGARTNRRLNGKCFNVEKKGHIAKKCGIKTHNVEILQEWPWKKKKTEGSKRTNLWHRRLVHPKNSTVKPIKVGFVGGMSDERKKQTLSIVPHTLGASRNSQNMGLYYLKVVWIISIRNLWSKALNCHGSGKCQIRKGELMKENSEVQHLIM